MESEKKRNLQVGIFVSLGLAFAMTAILFIGAERKFWQRNYNLYVSFPDIYGLQEGALVRLAGFEVGRVTKISFPKELEKNIVVVRLTINQAIQHRIRSDSMASIRTLGVLGDKYIAISLGSPSNPKMENSSFITAEQPYDVEEYLRKGGKMIDNIVEISESIKKMTANLEEGNNIGTLIERLNATSEKLDKVAVEIESGQGLLHDLVFTPKGGKLDQITNSLERTSLSLQSIATKIDNGKGTLGSLVNDPTLYDSLTSLFGGKEREHLLQDVLQQNIRKREELEKHRRK